MLNWISYLVEWAKGHLITVIALLIVGGIIYLAFLWAIRYGLRGCLIMIVAVILAAGFLIIFFGGFGLAGQMAKTLPGFLCSTIEYCPPLDSGSGSGQITPTPSASATSWVPGLYEVSHPSGTGSLHAGFDASTPIVMEIPNDTDVCIREFQPSNALDGCSFRGNVIGGDIQAQGWIHCSALRPGPIKACN